MTVVPQDYDADPERSHQPCYSTVGDVHPEVAHFLMTYGGPPVLDVGGGRGALQRALPPGTPWISVDLSAAQINESPRPAVRGDAMRLPIASETVGAAAALYMLYHVPDVEAALAEVRRVLRPGAVFAACTTTRDDSPELEDPEKPSPFDAEEAVEIVGRHLEILEVSRWDGPFVHLPDREAVINYLRSRFRPLQWADRVTPPLDVTKRGVIVYARK